MAPLTTEEQTSVPDFIEPPNWPHNLPDLNPIDYSVWGALWQLVYRQNSCWDMISQELIVFAIEQWSKPLSSVVCSRGKVR